MAVETAPVSVTMSLPVPPVSVSMLAMVTVLAKLPRVRLSLPAPRSIEPLLIAAPRMTVSAPVPPSRVSAFETVALFGATGQGQTVAAGAEIDRTLGEGAAECDGIGAAAADQGLNVGEVPVLPPAANVSLLAPAPRSTDIAVVSAVPRVMVSGPLPPAIVSALDTVAELVPGPKVSVSEPPPRSMDALLTPPRTRWYPRRCLTSECRPC